LLPLQRKTSLSELSFSALFRCTNDAGILFSNTQYLQKFSSYVDDLYNLIAILYSSEQLFRSGVTPNLTRDFGAYTSYVVKLRSEGRTGTGSFLFIQPFDIVTRPRAVRCGPSIFVFSGFRDSIPRIMWLGTKLNPDGYWCRRLRILSWRSEGRIYSYLFLLCVCVCVCVCVWNKCSLKCTCLCYVAMSVRHCDTVV
jgi:hypothetical protein